MDNLEGTVLKPKKNTKFKRQIPSPSTAIA